MVRRVIIAVLLCAAVPLILLWFGIWIPNEPSRSKFPIRGIDVSHHQRDIDWNSVKRSGIAFAYIKATEGGNFVDPKFSENWSGSKSAGITRGAYHFFILSTSGKTQASNFTATVPVEGEALPPAIDLEFSGRNSKQRPSPTEFQHELSVFWDAIVARYRKTPVVYTTKEFQKHYLARMPLERLWIREVITIPRQAWTIWQFTPRGRVSGVPTFVDLNVFAGGSLQLQELLSQQ